MDAGAQQRLAFRDGEIGEITQDRKSTRLNSSHANISYAVFCLKKKKKIFGDRFILARAYGLVFVGLHDRYTRRVARDFSADRRRHIGSTTQFSDVYRERRDPCAPSQHYVH